MTLFQLNNPSVKRLTSIYINTICLLLLPFFSKKPPPKLKHGDSKEYPLPQGRMKSPITMSQQKPLQLRFGGLVGKSNRRYRLRCLLHPHFGRAPHLRQRTHDRKSGPVGYRKKRGERTELSRVISLFIKKCGNSYSVSCVERHIFVWFFTLRRD